MIDEEHQGRPGPNGLLDNLAFLLIKNRLVTKAEDPPTP